MQVPGLEKARLYMESVTYFMRHGGAIEVGVIMWWLGGCKCVCVCTV